MKRPRKNWNVESSTEIWVRQLAPQKLPKGIKVSSLRPVGPLDLCGVHRATQRRKSMTFERWNWILRFGYLFFCCDGWQIFSPKFCTGKKISSNIEIPCKHSIDADNGDGRDNGDGTNDARDAKGCWHEVIEFNIFQLTNVKSQNPCDIRFKPDWFMGSL